ncbi:MAG: transketolase C-terminal domain-containing protein [Methylacidiphilales bacterium]|nr:transketolase C-terminal domain-containing protein [Candidatus Methylacidiphilales bacterium]
MGADTTVVDKQEAPALKPLLLKSKLASTPKSGPKYSVKIRNAKGEEVVVADPNATRAAVALMDVHAVNHGAACHWGGPAALAEAMASIHAIMFSVKGREWHEAYNFSNDAGHTENGVYALRANYGFDNMKYEDLRAFRSIKSKLTGHGESHLNPEGVLLSNGPLGSSLPQTQGLALADGVTHKDRVTICVVSDGAAMEGEAKEAFAAIPGLAHRGVMAPYVLVLSDNDTKLSGRITKDSFSMHPTFESLATLGWNVIHEEKGNDLQAVYLAVEKAIDAARKDTTKPVALWLKTVKGFGIKSTEASSSGGHGFPLANGEKIIDWVNEIYHNNAPEEFMAWAKELRALWEQKEAAKKAAPPATPSMTVVKKTKIQEGLSKAAIRAVKEGYPIFSVSADLAGSTGIAGFQKTFPERAIDVGVAESNMVSTAAGLSKLGLIPIVDTFAQFGVTKGNLPLTMSALSQAPVIALFSHTGFQDAADGASHQATTYFAATSPIPHTVVIACSCADEAEAYLYQAITRIAEARESGHEGESAVFFLGRENYPVYWKEGATYEWGKAQALREGSDITLVTNGPLVGKALQAADLLKAEKISATVINSPFVNRLDLETIGAAVKKTGGKLVTMEDHQVVCGFGSQLVHALVNAGHVVKARSLGIPGEFGQSAYMADELYNKYGLNAEGFVKAAKSLLG